MGETTAKRRVVISPEQFLDGSPMQQDDRSVRDLKLVYPETGFEDASTLCLGLVEIDPGHHSPLHRHKCEEVYYVVKGSGEIEVEGERHSFGPGSAIFNRPNTIHRVWNTGDETVQLVVVGGVMFVPLWPQWPTDSPYEVFEGTTADQHRASEGAS
jgi:quercetin dioxygenase-like cupin family protein